MNKSDIDIGDLAKISKISTSAIRFYEQKGFIKSIGRKGLRRQYPIDTINLISLIKLGKSSGLILNEIKALFFCNTKISIDRDLIDQKIDDLTSKIEELNNSVAVLKHIQQCPFEEHIKCPSFIQLLNNHHNCNDSNQDN